MYRQRGSTIEMFLVHPGGPFWVKKDLGPCIADNRTVRPSGGDVAGDFCRELFDKTVQVRPIRILVLARRVRVPPLFFAIRFTHCGGS